MKYLGNRKKPEDELIIPCVDCQGADWKKTLDIGCDGKTGCPWGTRRWPVEYRESAKYRFNLALDSLKPKQHIKILGKSI